MSEIIIALLNKLHSRDQECEKNSLDKILILQQQTRYQNGKLYTPSFSEASQVWLTLIREKEKQITDVLDAELCSIAYLNESELNSIVLSVAEIFSESKYIERLTNLKSSVIRIAQSYGIASIEERFGNFVVDAAYRAAASNANRSAIRNIESSLQLSISKRSFKMGFESLMTDKVTVLKKNGERFDNLSASVQSKAIFIQRADILIESGDLVTRSMSNGGQETFEVIDPGFHEKFHSIPAGYQMRVQKLGIPEAKAATPNITNIITGRDIRVNTNSVDNSTSLVVNSAMFDKVEELRQAIHSTLPPEQIHEAVALVDALEQQLKSGRPSKSVVTALLAGIPHAANIATIISAIVGFL